MEKKVIELFAGVGGFRVGLNEIKKINKDGRAIEKDNFEFVWANQWEPSTKVQHAFDCYNLRFNDSRNSNIDITLINKKQIPDHSLLCGGFPCQDYSVAHSKSKEKGIEGKKGVLWWQIRDILKTKKPPFVLLENVDRLIKSPAKQRGRDFGIMLRCFADLGYIVEWRVINAAEYGGPQRRRRIFIFASKKSTKYAKQLLKNNKLDILLKSGIFASQFPVEDNYYSLKIVNISHAKDMVELSNSFEFLFENSGILVNGIVYTTKTQAIIENPIVLKDIVVNDANNNYFLNKIEKTKFKYLRGSKKILRTKPDGSTYYYSEGSMSEYDDLTLPGRTMLTSEGSLNRSSHIIKDPVKQRLRKLTPIECERLNQFPDNWTDSGMPEKRRCFMMGNALVCGIVSRIGREVKEIIENE